MSEPALRIYDIMACNVYWDFVGTPLPKEQHKFLVSFYPTPGARTPDLIESIVAKGPDGYTVTFGNEAFTADNRNGWIYDGTLDYYWYMVNLPTGYLPEGEYTIEVTGTDGQVLRQSRVQDNEPCKAIIDGYEASKPALLASYSPSQSNPLPPGSSLSDVTVWWTPLNELAGVDAYYVYRIAKGSNAREFDTQRLVWWDNIFIQAVRGDATAGLNRGEVTLGAELESGTTYAYFVEITDGNKQSDTNICIFQPHQVFTAP